MNGRFAVIATLFLGGVFDPTRALAQVACGAVLNGGSYVMTADILDCAIHPALTLDGEATLDMNAHRLTCDDTSITGIRVLGTGVRIENGRVSDCAVGIDLQGAGGHKLSRLVLLDNAGAGLLATSGGNTLTSLHARNNGGDQISVSSDGNKIVRCNASGGSRAGLRIDGSANKVVDSTASDNDLYGFQVGGGRGNSFVGCLASSNDLDGFHVEASSTKIKACVATANGDDGFSVGGTDNSVTKNKATMNAYGFFTGEDECHQCVFASNNAADNTVENFDLGGNDSKFKKNEAKGSDRGMSMGPEVSTTTTESEVSENLILGAEQIGLEMYGSVFKIKKNRVIGSETADLSDDGQMCASNIWENNLHATTHDGCEQ